MHFGNAVTLGDLRAPLVFLALFLIPVLCMRAATPHRAVLAGYLFVAVVLIFFPLVNRLAGKTLGAAFYFRLAWSVPVPLLVSLALGLLATRAWRQSTLAKGGFAAFLIAFALSGPWAVTRDMASRSHFGAWKVHRDRFEVAREVVAINGPREMALVAEQVAMYVPGIEGAPPMLGVRHFYLKKLQRLNQSLGLKPDSALEARRLLFVYMGGGGRFIPFERALVLMRAANPRTVVFRETHRDAAMLVPALASDGYSMRHLHGFVLAVRAPAS